MLLVLHVAGRCRIDENRGAGEDHDREQSLAGHERTES
jgi:hypothetical protein